MKIDNDIAPTPKRPKQRKPSKTRGSKQLQAAVFLEKTIKKAKVTSNGFCYIKDGWALVTGDMFSVGTPLEMSVNANPKLAELVHALRVTGQGVTASMQGDDVLLEGDGTSYAVDCTLGDPPGVSVNPRVVDAANDLLDAISKVIKITSKRHDYVLLQSHSVVATNRHVVVKAFHNYEMPCEMVIQTDVLKAVLSCGKRLTGLGASGDSFTFWFDDNSFIQVPTTKDCFPQYEQLFKDSVPVEKTDGRIFDGLRKLKTADCEFAYFTKDGLVDDISEPTFRYKMEGLTENVAVSVKQMLLVEHLADNVYFDVEGKVVYFEHTDGRSVVAMVIEKRTEV